jgi:putative transposase
MPRERKRFSAEFKGEVALEALRGVRTTNQIATERGVHPNLVANWKKQAAAALPSIFSNGASREAEDREKLTEKLYEEIGRLKVELDWFKKKSGC